MSAAKAVRLEKSGLLEKNSEVLEMEELDCTMHNRAKA